MVFSNIELRLDHLVKCVEGNNFGVDMGNTNFDYIVWINQYDSGIYERDKLNSRAVSNIFIIMLLWYFGVSAKRSEI